MTQPSAAEVAVLATRNPHKLVELRRILAEAELDIELIDIGEAERRLSVTVPEVPETGATFEDNARLKSEAVCLATGLPALADDSGLCVDALNGMPGVLSARWSGPRADDVSNLALVLGQIVDIPMERRGAQFKCAAAFTCPEQGTTVVVGTLEGSLIGEPRGRNGFGYDPIFVPEGYDVTTAEMTGEQKDAISHRGRAFRRLALCLADRRDS
jgi:XTP/dITP diphosphohydrolase